MFIKIWYVPCLYTIFQGQFYLPLAKRRRTACPERHSGVGIEKQHRVGVPKRTDRDTNRRPHDKTFIKKVNNMLVLTDMHKIVRINYVGYLHKNWCTRDYVIYPVYIIFMKWSFWPSEVDVLESETSSFSSQPKCKVYMSKQIVDFIVKWGICRILWWQNSLVIHLVPLWTSPSVSVLRSSEQLLVFI